MSGLLADLHFLRPAWLLLLPLLPLLLWLRRGRARDTAWEAHCDPGLLAFLAEPAPSGGRRGVLPLLLLAWLLAVLALAGPAWERAELPVYRSGAARVLVLDLSRSMDSPDLVPTRLVRARFKAADLLTRSADGMVGLVVFAGDAYALAPLTEDVNTLLNLLPPLETDLMPLQGSRADLGLTMAATLLQRAGVRGGDILLLTDGAPPEAVEAARAAREAGHRVGVLAVGTSGGAPIPDANGGFLKDAEGSIVVPRVDAARLLAIAEAGGGRYATLSPDDSDIDRLLRHAELSAARTAQDDARGGLRHVDRGPWLLLALLPLAALGFRRGWLLGAAGAALLLPPPATALDWADLWQRPEQQVRAALAAGDAETALAAAADAPPAWQAAARYRSGDYAGAAQTYASDDDATAHYNRGNALARAGRLAEAVAAYEAALSRAPDLEDAAFNRELVRRLMNSQTAPPRGQQTRGEHGRGEDEGEGERQAEAGDGGRGQQDTEGSDPAGDAGRQQTGADDGRSTPADGDAGGAVGDAAQSADDGKSGTAGAGAAGRGDGQEARGNAEQGRAGATDGPDPDEPGRGAAADAGSAPDPEQQARVERLLRRVPDDPGGLLRRKFAMEHVRRGRGEPSGGQPW